MALDLDNTNGLRPEAVKFLQIVKKFGWNVTTVAPRVGEEGNLFSYSTGLFYTYRHPEVLVFNLPVETAAQIINVIGDEVKAGKTFESGPLYSDVFDGHPCAFRPVLAEYYEQYPLFSMWLYDGDPFPQLQCFWPDIDERFPWDPDCDPSSRESQPLLYLPSSTPRA
jgi:Domain of unknown function (DUF4262)